MKKALVIVDCQYDFFEVSVEDYKKGLGGALAVLGSLEIIPFINKLLPLYDLIIFTKDWHTPDNIYFASQHKDKKPLEKMELNNEIDTLWPDHCIQNTRGADIHDDINLSLIKGEMYIWKKGDEPHLHPYGAFGDHIKDTGLEKFLKEKNVTDIDIVGLALDYCCKDTALDSVKRGFKTKVFLEGMKAIGDPQPTIDEFIKENIKVINNYVF